MGGGHLHLRHADIERHLSGLSGSCIRRQLDSVGTGPDGSYRAGGGYRPKHFPEEYGFNAILLDSLVDIQKPVDIMVRGTGNLHALTAVTTDDESIYSEIGAEHFEVPAGKQLKHLYLIVMGAPEDHYQIPMPTEENPEPPEAELEDFPYEFWVTNKK